MKVEDGDLVTVVTVGSKGVIGGWGMTVKGDLAGIVTACSEGDDRKNGKGREGNPVSVVTVWSTRVISG